LQMEEDVGFFDPEGLAAYAAYFRDALVAGVSMDLTWNGDAVEKMFLVLQYRIGTSRLEGRIELRLNQADLPPVVFSMVKLAYHFDPTRKIATGTRNTLTIRNNAKLLEVTDDAEGGTGTADAPSAAAAADTAEASSAAAAAARAAKKRRVGGVNIFPGMRKVRKLVNVSSCMCTKECLLSCGMRVGTMMETSIP